MNISSLPNLPGVDKPEQNTSQNADGKGSAISETPENSFEEMLRRIVETARSSNDKETASKLAMKRINALMDDSVLDMMDENPDETPAEGPQLPWNVKIPKDDVVLTEASKNQQVKKAYGTVAAKSDFDAIIGEASRTYGVDPDLIKSVIKAESGFNPNSTSPKGAMGLMQLMPGTAKDLGVQNAYDPHENVMGGTRYLKKLIERYHGDTSKALAAYNWGAGNVERNPEKMPEETRNYISRITQYYRDIKA